MASSTINPRTVVTEKKSPKESLFTCGLCKYATPDPETMSHHINYHITRPYSSLSKRQVTSVPVENLSSADQMESTTAGHIKSTTAVHMESTSAGHLENTTAELENLPEIKEVQSKHKCDTPKDSKTERNRVTLNKSKLCKGDKGVKYTNFKSATTDIIASEALIGFLEPRRVKLNLLVAKPNPTPRVIEETAKMCSSATVDFRYKHLNPVLVTFCTSKNKVIATACGVKEFQETTDNPLRTQTSASKSPINSMSERLLVSSNTQIKSLVSPRELKTKIQLGLAKFAKIANSNSTDSNNFQVLSPTENKPTARQTKTLQPQTSGVIVEKIGGENNFSLIETYGHSKTLESQTEVVGDEMEVDTTPLTSRVRTHKGESFSHWQPAYKKPKKSILRRYQEEINRVDSPVESVSSTATEGNAMADLIDAEPPTKAAEVSTVSSDLGPDYKDTYGGSIDNFPKLILSQCKPNKSQNLSSISIANKLKSSLRHCWSKVSTSPSTIPRKNSNVNKYLQATPISMKKNKLRKLQEKSRQHCKPRTPLGNSARIRQRYKCEFCLFSTDVKAEFVKHANQEHSLEEQMYVCTECEYLTSRESKLIAHSKIHKLAKKNNEVDAQTSTSKSISTEVPYIQPLQEVEKSRFATKKECAKSVAKFNSRKASSSLQMSEQKPFKCRRCQFAASRWDNYIRHQLTAHKDIPELPCHLCWFTCLDVKVLKAHRLSEHQKIAKPKIATLSNFPAPLIVAIPHRTGLTKRTKQIKYQYEAKLIYCKDSSTEIITF